MSSCSTPTGVFFPIEEFDGIKEENLISATNTERSQLPCWFFSRPVSNRMRRDTGGEISDSARENRNGSGEASVSMKFVVGCWLFRHLTSSPSSLTSAIEKQATGGQRIGSLKQSRSITSFSVSVGDVDTLALFGRGVRFR